MGTFSDVSLQNEILAGSSLEDLTLCAQLLTVKIIIRVLFVTSGAAEHPCAFLVTTFLIEERIVV